MYLNYLLCPISSLVRPSQLWKDFLAVLLPEQVRFTDLVFLILSTGKTFLSVLIPFKSSARSSRANTGGSLSSNGQQKKNHQTLNHFLGWQWLDSIDISYSSWFRLNIRPIIIIIRNQNGLYFFFSTVEIVVLAIVMTVMMIVVVVGNMLVIIGRWSSEYIFKQLCSKSDKKWLLQLQYCCLSD